MHQARQNTYKFSCLHGAKHENSIFILRIQSCNNVAVDENLKACGMEFYYTISDSTTVDLHADC